jgi:tagatose 1,6-diphosphate aldolase GatY/KbaY
MSIVSGNQLRGRKPTHQLSLPSFDVAGGNVDMLHGVCRALKRLECVAFVASTPSSIKSYHGFSHFVRAAREVSDEYGLVIAAHLDHATANDDIARALDAGFSSIMIDASSLSLDENIERTQQVVQLASRYGASVEGEIGRIGGKEDDVDYSGTALPAVEQVERFAAESGIDFVAAAVGTAHGFYGHEPAVDWSLASALSREIRRPLVLHGATGLQGDQIVRFVSMGFAKVNYATAVRAAFRDGICQTIHAAGASTKPQTYLASGSDRVCDFAATILTYLCAPDTHPG